MFYFELYKRDYKPPRTINRMQIVIKKTKETLFVVFRP